MAGMLWYVTSPEAAGFIPAFVSAHDPRPVVEQINESYQHGGGWNDFEGFKLTDFDPAFPFKAKLIYPGDPAFKVKAYSRLRGEHIFLFDYDWCVVTKDGESIRCARLD